MHARLTLCLALLALPLAAAEPGGDLTQAYTLKADHQEYVEGVSWKGSGNVKVLYQDIAISCDEMELDLVTRMFTATGNVIMDQGSNRFTADEVRFDLRTKTGKFFNATGTAAPSYSFSGAMVEKLDEHRYRLEDATFSSCESGERPAWRFKIRKAKLEEEGYGRFKGTSLQIKGVPVFYLPYLVWPVKTERAAGLLMPSYGYSERRGAYLGNALYIPIGRSWDTTIYLDAYSKGHLGLGNQWRWAPEEGAEGEITMYALRDSVNDQVHWKVNGKHRQEDFFGFRLLVDIEDLDDIEFFREFERSFDKNTQRYLYSQLYLTRSWGPYSLNLRTDRRTTFYTSDDITLSQLPEVELRARPTRVGRSSLYWSLVSSVNVFDVDKGPELATTYERADLFPRVQYTLPSPPWLSITPRLGARGTYYTARLVEEVDDTGKKSKVFADEPLERTYMEGGVDIVGPSFSKVFNLSLGSYKKFKHLIEPRFEYSYLSYFSDEEEVAAIHVFDEVDSALLKNRVRVTLANRLYGRSAKDLSARELASFEVFQEYSFDEALSRTTTEESQKGPLNALLRVSPTPTTVFDARASYDSLYKNLRSTSLAVNLLKGSTYTNLTWFQSYNPANGERSGSQVRTSLGLGGNESRLQLALHVSYDIEKEEYQQGRIMTRYGGSCWGVSLEYRDYRIGAFPSRDYRIVIDLKDVGRLFEIQGGLNSLNE